MKCTEQFLIKMEFLDHLITVCNTGKSAYRVNLEKFLTFFHGKLTFENKFHGKMHSLTSRYCILWWTFAYELWTLIFRIYRFISTWQGLEVRRKMQIERCKLCRFWFASLQVARCRLKSEVCAHLHGRLPNGLSQTDCQLSTSTALLLNRK